MTVTGAPLLDTRIRVDVWSDVMCPFCYLGDTQFTRAVARFADGDRVDVRFRSFQLHPELPPDEAIGIDEFLARKMGGTPARAAAMNENLAEQGRRIGLDFHFEHAVAANTRRAHELSHLAADRGLQHEMIVRLFEAQFVDGLNVSDPTVLVDLAVQVGLDRGDAVAALDDGRYVAAVDADIDEARRLGISGVPFFLFDGRYAVSGAQGEDAFLQVLEKVTEPGG